jgi:hypothetical protein
MKVEIEDIKKDKEDMYLSAFVCLPEHGAHASVKKSKRLHFFRIRDAALTRRKKPGGLILLSATSRDEGIAAGMRNPLRVIS